MIPIPAQWREVMPTFLDWTISFQVFDQQEEKLPNIFGQFAQPSIHFLLYPDVVLHEVIILPNKVIIKECLIQKRSCSRYSGKKEKKGSDLFFWFAWTEDEPRLCCTK